MLMYNKFSEKQNYNEGIQLHNNRVVYIAIRVKMT